MRVRRILAFAVLIGVAFSQSALARQTAPPKMPMPADLVRIDEIGGNDVWFTIVAEDDSLSFAMPAKPTVETVQEMDSTVTNIYQCQTGRALFQVLSAGFPEFAARKRAGLSPELYARLGFEMLLLGVRSEATDASARFVRSVTQNGMVGGDGVIVASSLAFPYHVRVLRGTDGRMIVIGAIAAEADAEREDIGRFMASVSRQSAAEARGRLKLGTREFLEVSTRDAVASTEPMPELTWERIEPAGAGFAVEMPPLVDPATTAQLYDTARKPVEGEKYLALSGQVVLMLVVVPHTSTGPSSPRSSMLSALTGFAQGLKGNGMVGQTTFEREVTQNGVAGAQGRVKIGEDGAFARIRTFETPTQLYMLVAIVLYPQAGDDAAINRFFGSFEFRR